MNILFGTGASASKTALRRGRDARGAGHPLVAQGLIITIVVIIISIITTIVIIIISSSSLINVIIYCY